MKKEILDAVAGIDERFILEAAEVQRQPAESQRLPESGAEKLRSTSRRWSWGKAAVIVFCLGLTAAGVALLLQLAPLSSTGQTPGTVISPSSASSEPTQDPHTVETAGDALEAEIQAAIAAKQPKQLWAADFFPETGKEVPILRYSAAPDLTECYQELLDLLLPDAEITKKITSPSGTIQVQLKQGRTTLICNCDPTFIQISGISAKENFPKAADWFSEKTGLELQEWTNYNRERIESYRVFTGSVDGLPIGALVGDLFGNNRLDTGHGIWLNNTGIVLYLPISVGEEAGTVRLGESFSPEEIRMAAEFRFSADAPVIEVYRSCELCYLIQQRKGQLIPVWWVKGTRYNYETGKETAFEMVFDAETGSMYDFMG